MILTAGCAKYRYNKLDLGDIGGIPRVIDAGQCNDSYSLVVIAQKLAEAFGLKDINDLPVSYNIAWYEQKAVLVLLALLSLGVKNITLGPTLPACLSPNVLKVLVENFNIKPNTTVEEDMKVLLPQAYEPREKKGIWRRELSLLQALALFVFDSSLIQFSFINLREFRVPEIAPDLQISTLLELLTLPVWLGLLRRLWCHSHFELPGWKCDFPPQTRPNPWALPTS